MSANIERICQSDNEIISPSGIIISNLKTDGYGAQLLSKLSAWIFCQEHNFKYMHTPIIKCHHSKFQDLDEFFKVPSNFDDNEIHIKDLRFEIAYGQQITNTIERDLLSCSFSKNYNFEQFHWHTSYYSDKYFSYKNLTLLRHLYDNSQEHQNSELYLEKKQSNQYDKIVAIHLRKGDVNENTPYNFNPANRIIYDETILHFIDDIREKFPLQKICVLLYTHGSPEQLERVNSLILKNREDVFLNRCCMKKSFHDFVTCNILFTSISAFSYIPALLNKNDIYYVENYMYYGLAHWHKFTNIHKKLFVVLEQGSHANTELARAHKKEFTTSFSDFYRLNWKDDKNDKTATFFSKNITWSEGRNLLYKKVAGKYKYYVFIDDDIIIKSFSGEPIAKELKYLLEKYNPISATTWNTLFDCNVITPELGKKLTAYPRMEKEAFPVYCHDLCVHIFQDDFAELMFPVYFQGSGGCMMYAQFIAHKLFPDKIMAFSTLTSRNSQHNAHCDHNLSNYSSRHIIMTKFMELLNSPSDKEEFNDIISGSMSVNRKNHEVFDTIVSENKVTIDKELLSTIMSVDHIKSPPRR